MVPAQSLVVSAIRYGVFRSPGCPFQGSAPVGNLARYIEHAPSMDQAYSALLEDLEQRGMFDETLVVWMREFGRSPKIIACGGRDHWGHVFSATLAGGGAKEELFTVGPMRKPPILWTGVWSHKISRQRCSIAGGSNRKRRFEIDSAGLVGFRPAIRSRQFCRSDPW